MFNSPDRDLVPGGGSMGRNDVYVRDLVTGTTERVNIASDGTLANDPNSGGAAISADGRFVGFWSLATNLVPGDTNGFMDIFVHDRLSHTTERVSVASDGAQVNNHFTISATLSADGRFVAFDSNATNLVADDTNEARDVFVHDRLSHTTERVSVASDGAQGTGQGLSATSPQISEDGRFVAFVASFANLVPGDTNEVSDIFVHDRTTGTTERVSIASDGSQATCDDCVPGQIGNSISPRLSGDGRYVSFVSRASSLVPGDTNGVNDSFVHDRETGTTERVSVFSDGSQSNGTGGTLHDISANGRFVTFNSNEPMVPGDTNGQSDLFIHDRVTGAIERISVASDGTEANGFTGGQSVISGDGRIVFFPSSATNLVPGDTNGGTDGFVRIRASSGPTQTGEDTTVVPTATDNTGSGIDPTLTTISFDNVTVAGDTTMTIDDEAAVPPGGLKLGDPPVVFDIQTTAEFDGTIEICIDYTTLSFGAENLLVLTHFTDPDGAGPEPEQWVDITTVIDTDFNIICGSVTSLSAFALMEPKDAVELLDGLSVLIAELNSRQGIINGLDAKLDAALKARTDANANNNGAAVTAVQALIAAAQAQSGEQIPVSEADELIESAGEIIKVLTGSFF